MKKRILSLLLVAVMALSLLAGCGGGGDDVTTKAPETQGSGTETKAPETNAPETNAPVLTPEEQVVANIADMIPDLTGKTIKIVTIEHDAAGVDYSEILPIYKQIEELTGCTVEWEQINRDNYSAIMETRFTTDDLPDIFFWWGNSASQQKEFLDDGLVYDITSAYDVAPNIKKYYEEGFPAYYNNFNVDGAMCMVPTSRYNNQEDLAGYRSQEEHIYYRKDIAEELGFTEMPLTISDWYELLSAVKKAYPDMIPYNANGVFSYDIDDLGTFGSAWGIHGNLASHEMIFPDDKGNVVFQPMNEEMKAFVTEMNKWYEEGLLGSTAGGDNRLGLAAAGQVFAGMWSADNYTKNLEEIRTALGDDDVAFAAAPYPTIDGYEPVFMARNAWEQSWYICDNGDDRARAAIAFLDFAFFSDYGKYSQKFGVMGPDTWYFDENGVFQITEEHANAWGFGTMDPNVTQQGGENWWKAPTPNFSPEFDLADNKIIADIYAEVYAALTPYAYALKDEIVEVTKINYSHMVYAHNWRHSDDDQEILNQYRGDLRNYVTETLSNMIIGEVELSEWDNFVQTCYDTYNLQTILDVYARSLAAE